MEDSVYHVRPGHDSELHEVVKMVIAGYKKAGTAAHWGTFDINYGRPAGDYLVLSSRRSISEIDTGFAEDPKICGSPGRRRNEEAQRTRGGIHRDLRPRVVSVNPRQSYVDESWAKTDPDFCNPKPTAPQALAAGVKPAPAAAAKPASS